MSADTLRDLEGSNRLVTLLLGWQALHAQAVDALSVASSEPPLAGDNPVVLAALGFLVLNARTVSWLPTCESLQAAAPSLLRAGSLSR